MWWASRNLAVLRVAWKPAFVGSSQVGPDIGGPWEAHSSTGLHMCLRMHVGVRPVWLAARGLKGPGSHSRNLGGGEVFPWTFTPLSPACGAGAGGAGRGKPTLRVARLQGGRASGPGSGTDPGEHLPCVRPLGKRAVSVLIHRNCFPALG